MHSPWSAILSWVLVHRTLNSFSVSCFSSVCENIFLKRAESRAQRSSSFLCVCVTLCSAQNVLFLFQLKFHILGVHTSPIASRFFTFAFSVSFLFVCTQAKKDNFVYIFSVFGDFVPRVKLHDLSIWNYIFRRGSTVKAYGQNKGDDKWLCHWAWEVSLRDVMWSMSNALLDTLGDLWTIV